MYIVTLIASIMFIKSLAGNHCRIKHCLFFILFFNFFYVYAQPTSNRAYNQSQIDSLYQIDQYQVIVDYLKSKDTLTYQQKISLARSLGRLEQFSNALVLSNSLVKAFKTEKDTSQLVIACNLKAENLFDLNRVDEGLKFCIDSKSTFRKQDSFQLQLLYFKWGAFYIRKKNYEKAYSIYNSITEEKFRNTSTFLNNFAIILLELKRWDEALVLLNKRIDKNLKTYSPYLIDIPHTNIAEIYLAKGNEKKAEEQLNIAYNTKSKYTTFNSRKIVFEGFYKLYLKQNKTTQAKACLDSIFALNDKIFKQKLNEKLTKLDNLAKHEKNLRHKVKVIDNKLVTSETQKFWIAFAFIISALTLSVFILLLKLRNSKVKNSEIQLEQKLLRSQMTPHFIFNSLSVLQGIILNGEVKKSIFYLSKFSKLLRIILENSREKKVPLKQEIAAIKNYLILQSINLDDSFSYKVVIDKNIDTKNVSIPPMLIQPFVENAIEHAFKGIKEKQIIINIKNHQNKLICKIEDNGCGFNEKESVPTYQSKKSLATTITSERLQMLFKDYKTKGSVTIEGIKTGNQQGTLVTLIIPYKTINT